MTNLLVRSLTGSLFVFCIVASLLLGEVFAAYFFAIPLVLTVYELVSLQKKSSTLTFTTMVVIGVSLLFYATFSSFFVTGEFSFILFSLSLLVLFLGIVKSIFLPVNQLFLTISLLIVPLFLIVLPFSFITAFYSPITGLEGAIFPLAFFAFIWINDTFAYLVGVRFGKHRLYPRLSPKKSIEGSIGGALFSLIGAIIFSSTVGGLSMLEWLGFALVIVVFGTLGDLLESALKRAAGVKDSGSLLPGHGGFLDRFDSMLLAAPMVYLYFMLITIC